LVHCSDIFDTFITEGEECVLGRPIERPYAALEPDQMAISFQIYKSRKRNVQYASEFMVHKIGSFSIDIHHPKESVEFAMIMTTELVAKARNKAGQEREVKLKFTD